MTEFTDGFAVMLALAAALCVAEVACAAGVAAMAAVPAKATQAALIALTAVIRRVCRFVTIMDFPLGADLGFTQKAPYVPLV
ncbi:hypothetical protein GCM10012285_24830 [Streptomyces kronopolitis]|uniref:Secreted protein n=1 Tax=Streptomyces kronopolitis TaxID=1612435 RepID=A0ABQ2JA59_9ACTN|nr:hypothetical protein GCM10012285_24830 [Streptomyces kronopolitis]